MVTTKVADVLAQTYDFIIVGGGTAGLALASRLSEDPSITVIVLEAGDNRTGDPMTSVPVPYGRQIGNPKKYSNDKVVPWARGKGLGGSSNINYTTWSLPPAVDVDVFEKLGNVGWNWNEFSRYIKKIEQFNAPKDEGTDSSDQASGDDIDQQSAGARPLQTSIPPHHTIYALASETLNNLGVEILRDPYSGQVNGTWVPASTIDPRTWSRSTSATAYLLPNQGRPNLFVLTQALVSRVILRDDGDGFVATGVEFIHEDIQHILNARKEVILSAGAIKSPQLLELSGIGRKDVLSKIGVDVKIELPGVGENLQEHNFVVVSYELDPSNKHETFDALRSPEKMQEAERL
ncbi:hypothetical protein H0H93_008976 [Arthromyces matolae]|nr:hypothetical protein H0H93_008976 [Arthromyces matolae]